MSSASDFNPFEECPPEIWSHILDIACLDDGTTARSLSIVSRRAQHLSHGHRYRSIKVDSARQLLKLEETISRSFPDPLKDGGRSLGTRALSITMPAPFHYDVYLEDSLEPETAESEDGDYQPSESTNDGSTDSEQSDQDDEDVEDLETGSDMEEEVDALERDLPLPRDMGHAAISDLSDMENSPLSLDRFDYRMQRAIRTILELCAETLEVFSWYFYPWTLAPVELLFPCLPRLRYLSIYGRNSRVKRDGYALMRSQRLEDFPLLFPSLEVFRMVAKYPHSAMWYADILRCCPLSKGLKIVTLLRHDHEFWVKINKACAQFKKHCNWEYFPESHQFYAELLSNSVKWWSEDVGRLSS
ncbi:hypothetical protein MD484_g6293, partial [Candolleomyces efflorescens]